MKRFRVFSEALLLLLFVIHSLVAGELTLSQRQKLHPAFQSLVSGSSTSAFRSMRTNAQGQKTFDAIVYTEHPSDAQSLGIHLNAITSSFATARLTIEQIRTLADCPTIVFIRPSRRYFPVTDLSVPEIGASLLHGGFVNNTPYRGAGAIVLIYDTGIDWNHLDFRKQDTTQSRILSIWDQTLTPKAGETSPSPFNYGVEYTQTQIQDEINRIYTGVVREQDNNGHGTHVAGIAAGNGNTYNGKFTGVAPDADIIVVKGGDDSFTDADMMNGLQYAEMKATQLGKPIVVNWSIGGQYGAHDGTDVDEIAVDSFVSKSGRAVCIAAGNDGTHNIHMGGVLSSSSSSSISFFLPSYVPSNDTLNNEFDFILYFAGNPNVSVKVISPRNISITRDTSKSGDSVTTDGAIELDNVLDSSNHNRFIELYVHQLRNNTPAPGTWTLTLTLHSSAIGYDGWLDENTVGNAVVTLNRGDNNKSVSMPGTSFGGITVGSYATKWFWPAYDGRTHTYEDTPDRTGNISTFSSVGPTRDGRLKPDIVAPGQGITAPLTSFVNPRTFGGYVYPGNKYRVNQGTSQATPHVTGAVALLLAINPSLTAAQIKTALTLTANSDSFTGTVPNYTWGKGKLDVLNAVMKSFGRPSSTTRRTILAYDQVKSYPIEYLTGAKKYAVLFSPVINGTLTGMQLNIAPQEYHPISSNGSLRCEIYTNDNGFPGIKIGSSTVQPFQAINPSTNNYIQMLSSSVTVSAGIDLFIVLSPTSLNDTLLIMTDSTFSTSRSLVYDGSTWSSVSSGNLKLRAIVTTTTSLDYVTRNSTQPNHYELRPNYPNPFNPSTKIQFSIPKEALVKIRVYNLLGQEVALVFNETRPAGTYEIEWDGKNANGGAIASGVYFYRMESGNYVHTERMVFLK